MKTNFETSNEKHYYQQPKVTKHDKKLYLIPVIVVVIAVFICSSILYDMKVKVESKEIIEPIKENTETKNTCINV